MCVYVCVCVCVLELKKPFQEISNFVVVFRTAAGGAEVHFVLDHNGVFRDSQHFGSHQVLLEGSFYQASIKFLGAACSSLFSTNDSHHCLWARTFLVGGNQQ